MSPETLKFSGEFEARTNDGRPVLIRVVEGELVLPDKLAQELDILSPDKDRLQVGEQVIEFDMAFLAKHATKYPLRSSHLGNIQILREFKPVDVLGLPPKARNALVRAHPHWLNGEYFKLSQLDKLSNEELLLLRNFGQGSLSKFRAGMIRFKRLLLREKIGRA